MEATDRQIPGCLDTAFNLAHNCYMGRPTLNLITPGRRQGTDLLHASTSPFDLRGAHFFLMHLPIHFQTPQCFCALCAASTLPKPVSPVVSRLLHLSVCLTFASDLRHDTNTTTDPSAPLTPFYFSFGGEPADPRRQSLLDHRTLNTSAEVFASKRQLRHDHSKD